MAMRNAFYLCSRNWRVCYFFLFFIFAHEMLNAMISFIYELKTFFGGTDWRDCVRVYKGRIYLNKPVGLWHYTQQEKKWLAYFVIARRHHYGLILDSLCPIWAKQNCVEISCPGKAIGVGGGGGIWHEAVNKHGGNNRKKALSFKTFFSVRIAAWKEHLEINWVICAISGFLGWVSFWKWSNNPLSWQVTNSGNVNYKTKQTWWYMVASKSSSNSFTNKIQLNYPLYISFSLQLSIQLALVFFSFVLHLVFLYSSNFFWSTIYANSFVSFTRIIWYLNFWAAVKILSTIHCNKYMLISVLLVFIYLLQWCTTDI